MGTLGKTWILSDETRQRQSLSKMGIKNPRFGKSPANKTGTLKTCFCGNTFYVKKSHQHIRKTCSSKCNVSARNKRNDLFGFKKRWQDNPDWFRGANSPSWIKDRTKLIKRQARNDSAYKDWVNQCRKRDKVCQLKDIACDGYLVVHHIQPWSKFPLLRYEVTNGITLCQAHHPKTRAEEEQFALQVN